MALSTLVPFLTNIWSILKCPILSDSFAHIRIENKVRARLDAQDTLMTMRVIES